MRCFLILFFYLIGGFAFSQNSVNRTFCGKSKEKFVVTNEAGITWINYVNLDCKFSVKYDSTHIDSIMTIMVSGDTIDQFKDNELANYAEMLAYTGIPDWRLLVRINEMGRYETRRSETMMLTYTYRVLAPHLYGNYSGKYALIKTNKGLNFVDRSGQLVFDCFFENATNFIDGKASVKLDGKWQSLDVNGRLSKI